MRHSGSSLSFIPDEIIARKVLLIRGTKVMFDQDLAELYEKHRRKPPTSVEGSMSRCGNENPESGRSP